MDYIIALLLGILLPPTLIGISSFSDKKEKNLSIGIVGAVIILMQLAFGKSTGGMGLVVIVIILILGILSVIFKDVTKDALAILLKTYNNFIKELQDPLLSTKETVILLLWKDVLVTALGILKIFKPAQCTIIMTGTIVYLVGVEMILQDNTELKSSWTTFIKGSRRSLGIKSSRGNEEEMGGEYIDNQDVPKQDMSNYSIPNNNVPNSNVPNNNVPGNNLPNQGIPNPQQQMNNPSPNLSSIPPPINNRPGTGIPQPGMNSMGMPQPVNIPPIPTGNIPSPARIMTPPVPPTSVNIGPGIGGTGPIGVGETDNNR